MRTKAAADSSSQDSDQKDWKPSAASSTSWKKLCPDTSDDDEALTDVNSDSASDQLTQLEHGQISQRERVERAVKSSGNDDKNDGKAADKDDDCSEAEIEESGDERDGNGDVRTSAPKQEGGVDEALRNATFHQFKKLESHYQTLANAVLAEKEKDLDRAEEELRNGTHPGLIKDLSDLEASTKRSKEVAKRQRACELSKIQTEYDANVQFSMTDFMYKKRRVRRRMLYNLKWIERQVVKEKDVNARRKLSDLILGDRPSKKVALLSASVAPYPVVEQFRWRCRENQGALASYQGRIDEFGSFVPPDFAPMGLHKPDLDADLSAIRQATRKTEPEQ